LIVFLLMFFVGLTRQPNKAITPWLEALRASFIYA
jgi:hypothetical protein